MSEVSKVILAGVFTIIAGVIGAMVAINTLEQGVEAAKAKTSLVPNLQIERVLANPFDGQVDSTPRFRLTNIGEFGIDCESSCGGGPLLAAEYSLNRMFDDDCSAYADSYIGPGASIVQEFSFANDSPVLEPEGEQACTHETFVREFFFFCRTRKDNIADLIEEIGPVDDGLMKFLFRYVAQVRPKQWTPSCDSGTAASD